MDYDDTDYGNDFEEEAFDDGMRQNAMEYATADKDADNKLDFGEFCAMVREREDCDFTEEELMRRFKALDADGSGKVDMQEYIIFSLRDALARSSTRVLDLFREWDEDGDGKIGRKEFTRAIAALGFSAPPSELVAVFDSFDTDGSGTLEYSELNKALRKHHAIDTSLQPGAAGAITMESSNKTKLRRAAGGRKGAALATASKLDPMSQTPMVDQLREVLKASSVRVIDIFRDWDEDGNGKISAKEFRKALATLIDGALPKHASQTLFDQFDSDRSGDIEYAELNSWLRGTWPLPEAHRHASSYGPP